MFRKTLTSNARVAIFKNADFSRAQSSYKIEYILAFFLDGRQPGPIKSVLLVIIGWLAGWLVGWLVTQFSQKLH